MRHFCTHPSFLEDEVEVLILQVMSIPIYKRPLFHGIFGAVFGIASVCGPLISGVFTTKISVSALQISSLLPAANSRYSWSSRSLGLC